MTRQLALLVFVVAVACEMPSVDAQPVVSTVNDSDPTTQIDNHIDRQWITLGAAPAKGCSDRVFVRRIYLDLAGRVPSPAEIAAFLSNANSNRRDVLIEELVRSEDYVQHFTDLFDALLMGRAAESKYKQRQSHHWRSYLESVVRDNRPWNEVVAEILLARPEDETKRGAVWFLYERDNKYQQIAESIAPAIFGVRIECAQCHDHMMADEILQEHYWGLVAFFNRSKNENTKSGPRVAESAIGGFSEFADIHGQSSPNVLSFLGADPVHEDRPAKDAKVEDSNALYFTSAVEGEPRTPKFSRRAKFVAVIVEGHPRIARAMVNRVWAMLMSRGIVHPFDEMDSVHPPSHPELLDWLSDDFVGSGYDLPRLITAIVRSKAYQLDSIQPDGVDDPATFAWYLERPLTAEQLARSVALIVRSDAATDSELVGLFRQQFKAVVPDENNVTVSDALFMSNSIGFDKFLRESEAEQHLIPRLFELPDHASRADTVCEAVLGRTPTDQERIALVAFLDQRSDALESALRQVVWSLLTSAEFRFNH